MNEINEYITYLKSFNDKHINENISLYYKNIIDFNDLEYKAIEKSYLSKYNYFKSFKLGNILNQNKSL